MAIGDVAGHDINAAAEMGQLRRLLRACAYQGCPTDPGQVLDRLDELVLGLRLGTLATVTYAGAVPTSASTSCGAGWRVHVTTAGPPPVIVHSPDGAVAELDEVHGLMIGVDPSRPRTTTSFYLCAGSTILAYTDQLVEHRGADLDAGTADLLAVLAAVGPDPEPGQLCESAMALTDNRLDDVACLSVTLH